jgi:CoA-dependent NAD(P)H sulfur oxidoreductase
MATKRLVVIGGGAAGMSAASAARRVDPALEIVVLEATGYAGWGLCGIPYYVAGVVDDAGDLVAHPPGTFRRERRIDLRLGSSAVALEPDRREVVVRTNGHTERLSYGALVVAAGAAPTAPPLPGLDNDDRIFTVRTLERARDLRGRLDAGRVGRALVVGAGYVGLEMAEALAAHGCEVVVAEMLDRVMPTIDPELASVVEEEVRRRTDLRLGVGLTGVDSGERLRAHFADGTSVDVDVVVLAAGVRPVGNLAAAAGARTVGPGALLVDDHMRTSLPGVFAAGDCIAAHHRVLGRPAFVPLGPAANKTGRVAGTVAAGGVARFTGMVGTAVAKIFDLTVARTGLTTAEAQAEGLDVLTTASTAGSRAKYYPGTAPVHTHLVHTPQGRLLGAQMVSADPSTAKRIDVFATALQAGFSVTDVAELDLSYAPPYAPVYDPVLRAAQAAQRSIAATPAAVA